MFYDEISFVNTEFRDTESSFNLIISNNIFDKVFFLNPVFNTNCLFTNCTFNDTAVFDGARSDFKNHLTFADVNFNQTANFNSVQLSKLIFGRINFKSTTSFQESKFDSITIETTLFEKAAHFDNLQIANIKGCSRITLRNIKQQLQKAENKIDYNRFRAYELEAYFRELTWKTNFKDWFILGATKIVSGFDHSWRRALVFSLISCLIFYSLFFISENYFYDFDITGWKRYMSGYFRFLLVTDLYSPLENGRTYIHNSNTIGWFLFILGKIVIAFGIYEIIQAFRKFKA